MEMGLTYARTGVDRTARASAKKIISIFKKPRGVLKTPFNDLFPLDEDKENYYVHTTDGVGTKVLLTELSGEHWVAGWDAIAMVVNDAIRCGATPQSITNAVDIADSSGREFKEILEGIRKACRESGCFVAGGETADVGALVKGASRNPYHVNASCFATVEKKKIIDARRLQPGDVILGLQSSGLHSNGFSLVRKALFKQFGGAYDASGREGRRLLGECVKPTRLYVKPFLAAAGEVDMKAAVNVTGDAFLKFEKLQNFSKGVGFEFDYFQPQKIFGEIRRAGGIGLREMFKTFNMGWGFAVIVSAHDEGRALNAFKRQHVPAEAIGKVVKGGGITVEFEGKKIGLKK